MSVDITRAPYRQSGNVVRDSSTKTRLWVIWLYKKMGFQALFKFVKCQVKGVEICFWCRLELVVSRAYLCIGLGTRHSKCMGAKWSVMILKIVRGAHPFRRSCFPSLPFDLLPVLFLSFVPLACCTCTLTVICIIRMFHSVTVLWLIMFSLNMPIISKKTNT